VTDGGLTLVAWGAPALGDTPVPADYDADGKADVSVYRTTTGQWLVRRSTDAGLMLVAWGSPVLGDVPVSGDYDADGATDVAVYRTTTGVLTARGACEAGRRALRTCPAVVARARWDNHLAVAPLGEARR
jgi:hypothetical protein